MASSGASKNAVMIAVGVIVTLFGLLFMFQGLGAVKGSAMTNSNFWAIAGPVIAVGGAALVVRGARRGRPSDTP